jgi:LPXTG-site transpeptidase (sortase) family protein
MNRQFGFAVAAVVAIVIGALVIASLGRGSDDAAPGPTGQTAGAEPDAPRLPSPDAIAAAEDGDADPASTEDADAGTGASEDTVAVASAPQPAADEASDGADASGAAAAEDASAEETADDSSTEASPPPANALAQAPPAPPPAPDPASPVEGYRLRVPSLGVNAIMIDLGVDANGAMEVPLEAQTVAWYRFTSMPGEPGNILLGGHITWRGVTAVFRYLEEMEAGDEVYIDTPGGETIRYVVREAWWAQPYEQADVRRVIGTRSGQQTVTLFTCGGIWDTNSREYSHRRVVTAERT